MCFRDRLGFTHRIDSCHFWSRTIYRGLSVSPSILHIICQKSVLYFLCTIIMSEFFSLFDVWAVRFVDTMKNTLANLWYWENGFNAKTPILFPKGPHQIKQKNNTFYSLFQNLFYKCNLYRYNDIISNALRIDFNKWTRC